jgi:hypothetical protein
MGAVLAGCGPANESPAVDDGALASGCEASAVVPWDHGWLVADNEDDDHLHRYTRDFGPLGTVELSPPVEDVEALAIAPGGVWVVGSHGASRRGERRPERERVLRPDGRVLTLGFDACGECVAARGRAPDDGGLDVEGAAWVGDTLWIGLRSPLADDGAAILVAFDEDGRSTQVRRIHLGGLGVRDLATHPDGLLVDAGPAGDASGAHALHLVDPVTGRSRWLATLPPSAEGIASQPEDDHGVNFVTDGDGKPGKRCRTPATWGRVSWR